MTFQSVFYGASLLTFVNIFFVTQTDIKFKQKTSLIYLVKPLFNILRQDTVLIEMRPTNNSKAFDPI